MEIEFLIETKKKRNTSKAHVVTIEVKLSKKWNRKWESPARSLNESGKVCVDKMFGVYMGEESYHFDGFDVLPVQTFLTLLYKGDVY